MSWVIAFANCCWWAKWLNTTIASSRSPLIVNVSQPRADRMDVRGDGWAAPRPGKKATASAMATTKVTERRATVSHQELP